MKTKIIRFLNLWGPAVLWALLIFKLSSGTVPSASENYWQDFAVKKFAHVLFFGFLAVLIYRALRAEGVSRKKAGIWSIIFTFLYGATDEYHQMFTQGREARIRDVLFDGLGASLFIYLIYNHISALPKNIRNFLVKLGVI